MRRGGVFGVRQSMSGRSRTAERLGRRESTPSVATRVEDLLGRVPGARLRPVAIRFWDGSELPSAARGAAPTVPERTKL
jgi:hypothetical protein